ncbi:MAG: capsid cement protein [Pseudonocardiaceae bacterium]
MPDYIPIYKPGNDITLTVGATPVVGGNLVALSAANTVIPTTGATAAWLGVATQDAAVGAKVGVTSGGVQELVAGGAIAVGAMVIPAAGGKVVTVGAGTFGQNVGIAMTVAADGDKIRVKMAR